MSSSSSSPAQELRYERKFLVNDYSASEIEQMLKYHPAGFKELFYQRRINNIYFDTLGFESYYGNVEGDTERSKTRIRWYGDTFGAINKSTLEFKIKSGLLGKKNTFALSPFTVNINFSKQEIVQVLSTGNVPTQIKNNLLSMQPSLLNSYIRKYFISDDKKFRLTIDQELSYYRIAYFGNTFLNKSVDHRSVVVELKYDAQYETTAKEIGNHLPFAMTKNSKYLQGIERVLF